MLTLPQIPDACAVHDFICALRKTYPFLSTGSIGRSRLGRPIYSLTLGHGEKCVLLCGGFHAAEWLTVLLLLRCMQELCQSVRSGLSLCGVDVQSYLPRRQIVFVPCVNPDGTEIILHGVQAAGAYRSTVEALWTPDVLWNANAAGVDINHNFDAGWKALHRLEREQGIRGPAPRQYGGPFAESEPETRAVCDFCRRHQPLHALAFHSQGEEIFWRYGREIPPRSEALLHIFASSSGYTPADNAGLYAHGGFKDWFIETFHRPAFTVEIGKGQNPLPREDFDTIYIRLREMLTLACVL